MMACMQVCFGSVAWAYMMVACIEALVVACIWALMWACIGALMVLVTI